MNTRQKVRLSALAAITIFASVFISTPASAGVATTTTTTLGTATSITYGGSITGVLATVDIGAAVTDPTGDVTFYYCFDPGTAPTTCTSGTSTGSTVSLSGGTADDGIATATLSGWTPADGAGYYVFRASYAGDSTNDSSADTAFSSSLQVTKKTITVTPQDGTIKSGETFAYPFDYSADFVSPDTSADLDTEPTCGSSYSGIADVGTFEITCSGGSDNNYDFDLEPTATLTVNAQTPTTTYTGQTFDSDGGTTTNVSAKVSYVGCEGEVVFTVKDWNNQTVDTQTGSVNTSTGVATATVTLVSGIYFVKAEYSDTIGDVECASSSDDAAITVVNPFDPTTATVGGGYYKKSSFSPPRSNFAFTVQKVLSGRTLVGYKGQLLWMNSKNWRLKATLRNSDTTVYGAITCPTRESTGRLLPAGSKCVAFRGGGYLQKWNSETEQWETATDYGSSGWVTFTVTVYNGGKVSVCKTSGRIRTCSSVDQEDSFGIQIDPVASTVLPETLPVSLQLSGNNGSIQVK